MELTGIHLAPGVSHQDEDPQPLLQSTWLFNRWLAVHMCPWVYDSKSIKNHSSSEIWGICTCLSDGNKAGGAGGSKIWGICTRGALRYPLFLTPQNPSSSVLLHLLSFSARLGNCTYRHICPLVSTLRPTTLANRPRHDGAELLDRRRRFGRRVMYHDLYHIYSRSVPNILYTSVKKSRYL